jgi:hypothetical protein
MYLPFFCTAKQIKCDAFKSGGQHEERAAASWEYWEPSSFGVRNGALLLASFVNSGNLTF